MRTCLCDAGILNNKEKPLIFMLTIFSLFGAMLPSAEGKKCTFKKKKKTFVENYFQLEGVGIAFLRHHGKGVCSAAEF